MIIEHILYSMILEDFYLNKLYNYVMYTLSGEKNVFHGQIYWFVRVFTQYYEEKDVFCIENGPKTYLKLLKLTL